MNRDIFEGKWKQVKGDVQKRWGKLTDDALDEINGDSEKLLGKLQESYGIARDEAEKQLNDWQRSRAA